MTPIEEFAERLQNGSLPEALEQLGQYLTEQQRFHELFELRKVQLRMRLGLPVEEWQAIDDLPDPQGQALESGLLDICREVGSQFVRHGDLATGWSYLEPVGDKRLIRELMSEVPVTDENAEALIHISIAGGLDPRRGFQVVLDRFGTCSAITTYETQLASCNVQVRRGPTELLVRHVYRELVANIRAALEQAGQAVPDDDGPGTLVAMLESNPSLTEGLNHHIDTTHLASTVRFSKILDDPEAIHLAIELSDYGSQLHEDFQYTGNPPFAETYRDTRQWLEALSGSTSDDVAGRLHEVAVQQRNELGVLDSAAWYVYLLDQTGRGDQAVSGWLELLHQIEPDHVLNEDVAPTLQQLVRRYGLFDLASEVLRQRGDLLGFATVETARRQAAEGLSEQ